MDNGIEEEGCARAQANFSVRRPDVGVISTGVAHVLTWLAALLLVFAPIYQGVSVTPVTSGGAASEPVRFTSTLVDVNGLSVLPLLLVPVALTALGLIAVLATCIGLAKRRVLLWVSATLLLGFCVVSIFSIGLFYFPAAIALVVSAFMGLRRSSINPVTGI